jgi:hypothetical protein
MAEGLFAERRGGDDLCPARRRTADHLVSPERAFQPQPSWPIWYTVFSLAAPRTMATAFENRNADAGDARLYCIP